MERLLDFSTALPCSGEMLGVVLFVKYVCAKIMPAGNRQNNSLFSCSCMHSDQLTGRYTCAGGGKTHRKMGHIFFTSRTFLFQKKVQTAKGKCQGAKKNLQQGGTKYFYGKALWKVGDPKRFFCGSKKKP